jgi:hypothetical protein
MVTEQSNFFDGRSAGMPDLFNPEDRSEKDGLEGFSTGLSVSTDTLYRNAC